MKRTQLPNLLIAGIGLAFSSLPPTSSSAQEPGVVIADLARARERHEDGATRPENERRWRGTAAELDEPTQVGTGGTVEVFDVVVDGICDEQVAVRVDQQTVRRFEVSGIDECAGLGVLLGTEHPKDRAFAAGHEDVAMGGENHVLR